MEALFFLEGTWKVESKEQYETWEKNGNEFTGYMYKITENGKEIQETLTIKLIDNQIIYEATVPGQNEGKTIPFVLNTDVKTCFSFENMNHDFPKKIQYEKISENEIRVRVLGENENGFTLELFRQK